VGWFTHPIQDDAPAIRDAVQQVMQSVAAKLERN
jgi:hypothetical protein